MLFGTVSCIDLIEIEGGEFKPIVMLSGSFSDVDEVQTFFLSYSAPINGQAFQPFEGAVLNIKSLEGDSFMLNEKEPGVHVFNGQAELDKQYFIEIYFQGELLARSSIESVPEEVLLDSLSFEETYEKYTNVNGLPRNLKTITSYGNANINVAEDNLYLRYGELETIFMLPEITSKVFPPAKNCYIYNYDLNPELELFEIEKGTENVILKSRLFRKIINYEFAYVMSVKASLISYNKSSFDFWKELETLYNQTGQITDKVPAQFGGNIESFQDQLVKGQFSVVSKSEDIIFITRSDLEYKPLKLCGEVGGPYPPRPPSTCFECLSHEGATKDLPDYW